MATKKTPAKNSAAKRGRRPSPRKTPAKKSAARRGRRTPPGAEGPASARELIVFTKAEAGLRAMPAGPASDVVDVAPLTAVLQRAGATMVPLFGSEEKQLAQRAAATAAGEDPGEDLSGFYHVEAPDAQLDDLAKSLLAQDIVAAAYVKPPGEPPVAPGATPQPATADVEPVTPSYQARQIYLNPAPVGIDALYAWTHLGGRGAGVKIIDCEWGWNFTHEDLIQNQGGIVVGVGSTSDNHGTAVLGEYSGDQNSFGVTGICSEAWAAAASFQTLPSATVIRQAADRLGAGDIILLEIHRAGPRFNFQPRSDQRGYIAIEWWPDDYAAIRYATGKGILVVEAAGNGRENLDDALYDTPGSGFPGTWVNPFRLATASSRAVVVGAGNPPAGTHGRNSEPNSGELYVDRARCGFSNHGARIDCQAWGWEVTSTGYGDLRNGPKDEWYTDTFAGTSSASPIITGALGSLQGILRAQGSPLVTPDQARNLLRTTGSPQQAAAGRPVSQRIGSRPDLRQLIGAAGVSWKNNMTVSRTYSSHHAQNAWAYIATLGWRKIESGSADGVTNMFGTFCEAVANSRPVDVYVNGSKVYRVVLR